MTSPSWHKRCWLAVFGLTAAAAMAAPADEARQAEQGDRPRPLPTQPVSRDHKAKHSAVEATHVELERLKRPAPPKPKDGDPQAAQEAPANNVFAVTSWYVPPPPPPAPPQGPPPKPTAPPLPFVYLGRYDGPDQPKAVVMLLRGDQMYTVSEGDVIENTYRVEQVGPSFVELIYLPLNVKQSLQAG